MMEHVDFGDSLLEGEPTCEWLLNRVVQTGLTPVARSRAWALEAGVPAGDRSAYEHHVLMKVLEVACEVDQLNLMSLQAFELICRRVQVIEAAHAFSGANPDYTSAEDMMGWGVQRGGALVSPALTRHAANRASERTAVLKERRKFAEEMRLKKGGGGGGGGGAGGGGGKRGGGRGSGPPAGAAAEQ